MHFLVFPMHATYAVHLILLDVITLIIFGEESILWSSLLCNFTHPVTSCLRCILFSTSFSDTLSLCFSFWIGDQVWNHYKRRGEIKVLYTVIFQFSVGDESKYFAQIFSIYTATCWENLCEWDLSKPFFFNREMSFFPLVRLLNNFLFVMVPVTFCRTIT